MITLRHRHPYIVGLRVLYHPRRAASTVHWSARVGSYYWTPKIKPRRRGDVFRAIAQVLVVGRDLLLALWAIAALAFCLVFVAGFVL
jgi:hypothetical protein